GDLETDGAGNIQVKGAPQKSLSLSDACLAAHFKHGRSISGRGMFLVPRSYPETETGAMKPSTCYAHACTVAEVDVDDETGEVTVVSVKNVFEIGRALNPRMVEQQLVGGSWMGMSHALYETTEPYYPSREHGPTDFNRYLLPGPGDIPETEIIVLERPAADGPYGAKGPGEMCANPQIPAIANAIFDAVGVRIDHLPITPSAYYAHSGRNVRRDRTASLSRPPVTSSSEALAERFRQEQYIADDGLATAMFLALRLGKPLLLEGAPGVGKTEAAKVLAAVLDCELVRLQCYEGIDAAHALYEWNYQRQLLAIRQAGESEIDIYDDRFLIARPLLQVLQAPSERVLLIDEIDRSDHEFEALLLEF